MNTSSPQPIFSHAEPVLAVADVRATIKYWQDVLCFPTQWVWGDPPTHGAVSNGGAHVQFYENATRAKAWTGNAIWIRVKYIDTLYKMHRERSAEIVEPLERKPWGMDQYVVKEMNGYYLVFAGHTGEREKSGVYPTAVKIIERVPTVVELLSLKNAVGWSDSQSDDQLNKMVTAPAFGAVAVDTSTNDVVGCVLLLTDHASFYYVKDLMVRPEWQKQRIGTALMHALMRWLDQNAVPRGLVGLYTGENLEPFYRQFGFSPAFGMCKTM
jgi:GNAT superfamily N-acetyltransferase